jgi:hypothetical protein
VNRTETHSRALGENDIPGVVELFEAAFQRSTSPAHYRWKLRTRPSPVDNVAIAVDQHEHPVFHLAGVPCRCRLVGRERWAMIAVDGMTAPSYRRRGLLTQYTAELFARWRQAGIALVLGLPNEQWGSRTAALGWRPLFPLTWLVLPLRPERLLARKLRIPFIGRLGIVGRFWTRKWTRAEPARGITIEAVTTVGDELDELWTAARESISHSIVRDRAWVSWRYLEPPSGGYQVILARRDGRPCGYAAYRIQDWGQARSAIIAEVFTRPGDSEAFQTLAGGVIGRLVQARVDVVRSLAVPGSFPHEELRALGFLRSRYSFAVEHVALDPSLTQLDLRDPGAWYLTGGDFDVV